MKGFKNFLVSYSKRLEVVTKFLQHVPVVWDTQHYRAMILPDFKSKQIFEQLIKKYDQMSYIYDMTFNNGEIAESIRELTDDEDIDAKEFLDAFKEIPAVKPGRCEQLAASLHNSTASRMQKQDEVHIFFDANSRYVFDIFNQNRTR